MDGVREIRCPDEVQKLLLKAFENGEWDESDVPPENATLSKRDENVWMDVIEEAEKTQGATISKVERVLVENVNRSEVIF